RLIVLASDNPDKLDEARRILEPFDIAVLPKDHFLNRTVIASKEQEPDGMQIAHGKAQMVIDQFNQLPEEQQSRVLLAAGRKVGLSTIILKAEQVGIVGDDRGLFLNEGPAIRRWLKDNNHPTFLSLGRSDLPEVLQALEARNPFFGYRVKECGDAIGSAKKLVDMVQDAREGIGRENVSISPLHTSAISLALLPLKPQETNGPAKGFGVEVTVDHQELRKPSLLPPEAKLGHFQYDRGFDQHRSVEELTKDPQSDYLTTRSPAGLAWQAMARAIEFPNRSQRAPRLSVRRVGAKVLSSRQIGPGSEGPSVNTRGGQPVSRFHTPILTLADIERAFYAAEGKIIECPHPQSSPPGVPQWKWDAAREVSAILLFLRGATLKPFGGFHAKGRPIAVSAEF
ncbi:MAG: hypothetical protein L6Q57_09800, partial [Alphaproteobacteria bacterium]|nr:hypothetical protein [Alphaproteobacteria bacterium]